MFELEDGRYVGVGQAQRLARAPHRQPIPGLPAGGGVLESEAGGTLALGLADEVAGLIGCGIDACPARWRDASPRSHAVPGMAPVFFAYSHDDFVPPEQGVALAEALDEAGVHHESRLVRGNRHGLDLAPQVFPEVTAFLRESLRRAET